MSGSDGKVLDERDRVRAAEKRAARLDDDVGRRRRELGPDRHARDLASPTCVTIEIELLVLADVRAHVLAIHVRARQVQLERVGAFVLAGLRQRLPVASAPRRCPSPAMIDATRMRFGWACLMRRDARHPPVERLVGDQLPVPGRVQRGARAASASRGAANPASRAGTSSSARRR